MRRIFADYAFEEGEDFSSLLRKTGGRPRKDYLLSLDVAKEIAMIGNTPKGKATRRNFIAAEKAAIQSRRNPRYTQRATKKPIIPTTGPPIAIFFANSRSA